jgi:hypothetical protein
MQGIEWKEKVHMRLTFELVPQTCWYSNLRNKMTRANWDHLRTLVYATYNDRCGICHASRHISGVTLHCHEIWHYDDEHHVQRLAGFIALCEMCHHCKHIGLAGIRASERTLDFRKVIAHFMQVNQCSYEEYEAHSRAAWDTWYERNTHQWVIDLGTYGNLVSQP